MSETQDETVEGLEDFLTDELFSGQPRSPGEAAAAAPESPPEDAPEEVQDAPPERPAEEPAPPEEPEPEVPEEGEEPEPEETPEDEGLVWAKRKYGDDPAKWAQAARDMETHISRLTAEKRESDQLAAEWYEYAQRVEAQQQQLGGQMPLSAQEEQWVEGSLSNPLEAARQAAFSGRTQLYTGVINRIAEENAGLAAQIGTQVQMELASYAAQQEQSEPQPTLEQALRGSFTRLGINLQAEGPRMSAKLGELGEYHPYVRAILEGDDGQRDLAVQAVHDLVRATNFSPRKLVHEQAVQREEELRREAAVVQTGGITPPPPPRKESVLEEGMLAEWKRAGQWADDE